MKTLVVGAGISGLLLAKELSLKGADVEIWEKSPGLGGRMATRRGNQTKWDHGAQFYSPEGILLPHHERWLKSELVKAWPAPSAKPRFFASQGMNSLAKDLAQGLTIHRERRLELLAQVENFWRVHSEDGVVEDFRQVFLSCPLPQSLELLQRSSLSVPESWIGVNYAKAHVVLVSSKQQLPEIPFYQENPSPHLFSWTDMKAKGLSDLSAWVVVSHTSWSEKHWGESDESNLAELKSIILAKVGIDDLENCEWQLKKWRYAQPLSSLQAKEGIVSRSPLLAATGDAFGGGSIAGAVRGVEALLRCI